MRRKSIIFSLLIFLLATAMALGVSNLTGKNQRASTALVLSETTTIDANALEMFVYNDGNFAYDNISSRGKIDGLYFPRGTKKTVIYAAGLWLGAKIKGEFEIDTVVVDADTTFDTTQVARIAQAEYSSEFIPGNMENGTYNPNWQDNQYRVYKIKRGDTPGSNVDYANWPTSDGAPVDETGNPALLGDQLLWSVYNDADASMHQNESGGTEPLGVEVQQSTFAFARSGALGDCIFMKFKFINKGSDSLEDMYVSIWADPDLGNASDDLVGCDTALSLGYCYNSGPDDIYGAAPPAVGFDFFQGPIVPGEDTDTAYVSGVPKPGYKNLPMTSFAKYINGEDPRSSAQTYDFMNGLRKNPGTGLMEPAIDPTNGDTTTFVLSGDPVTGIGWLDTSPDDRRLMMSSGPFDMNPNDTQEVVCAVLVGQGTNPLNSITVLRTTDVAAQTVFDLNFDVPPPPPSPSVYARGAVGYIDLTWGREAVGDVQINEPLNQEFHFEGINLYEGETAVGPWHKFATYDREDDFSWICDSTYNEDDAVWEYTECTAQLIYGDEVDPAAGGSQRVILQKGSDSGLDFHLKIDRDEISGALLEANRPYYFAVTAYSYDYRNIVPFYDLSGNLLGIISPVLESPIVSYEVRPETQPGYFQQIADHSSGVSDGTTYIEYMYPSQITGNNYEVTFNQDLTWNLTNLTTGETLLEDMTNQSENYEYPVVEGLMVRATGLPPGIKDWAWEGGTRWLSGVDGGGDFFFGGLFNGIDFFGASTISPDETPGAYVNVEIRFSHTDTQKGHDFLRGGDPSYGYIGFFDCPFTVWDVSSEPARQLNVCFVENKGSAYDSTWFPTAAGDGGREYLFIMDSDYTGQPDPAYTVGTLFDPMDNNTFDCLYAMWPTIRGGHDPATEFEDGQKFIIYAAKPNLTDDVFKFTADKVGDAPGQVVPNTLADVKTVPNPYYAYYPEEVDQFDRIIKFINMPAVPMKIKIFNLAGDLVRTMERGGNDIYDSEYIWDLKTDNGLWVASGIYVWLIEAEGLGSRFGKMAIFTEVEQLNNF